MRTANLTGIEAKVKILVIKKIFLILIGNRSEIELPFIACVIITKEDTSPTYLLTCLQTLR